MISMIVPVYNEEENIKNTLKELKIQLQKLSDFQIIVVNDGSTDATLDVLSEIEGIKIISYSENRGKGFALRKGIMHARGQIIGFIDGDGEISPQFISKFYTEIKNGSADVVIGRKQNLKKSLIRKIYSVGFKIACLVLFGIIIDTQTGIKMFNNKIKSLSIMNDGFLFDLELIIACKEKNLTIKEIPVQLSKVKKHSRIGWRQALQMLLNLLCLKVGRQSCSGQQSYGYYSS